MTRTRDIAALWQIPALPGAELFQAAYQAHVFGRHVHTALAVGVVDSGVGAFWCRGKLHIAPAHTLVLINPGEVHTGGVYHAEAPLHYRMLYLPPDLLSALLPDASPITFGRPAPLDRQLAAVLRELHRLLRTNRSPLVGEASLLELLAQLVARYGEPPTTQPPAGVEGPAVAIVRDYLHTYWDQHVSLRDLASLVGLHPAYLNRSFRQAIGLPPHAYQLQLRVEHARALLAAGTPIAAAATACGFADQSHFTRQFRRHLGLTPARYQAAYQSGSA